MGKAGIFKIDSEGTALHHGNEMNVVLYLKE